MLDCCEFIQWENSKYEENEIPQISTIEQNKSLGALTGGEGSVQLTSSLR
jgi:hypothetical protein